VAPVDRADESARDEREVVALHARSGERHPPGRQVGGAVQDEGSRSIHEMESRTRVRDLCDVETWRRSRRASAVKERDRDRSVVHRVRMGSPAAIFGDAEGPLGLSRCSAQRGSPK